MTISCSRKHSVGFPVLRSHRLLGFIDGSLLKPYSPSDAAQRDRLNKMGLGWILFSLSPAVLAHVVDKSTAREAWLTLEQVYGTSSRSRIQQSKTELQSLQKGSKTIHAYLQSAKSLSLAFASSRKSVDEEDLILWTLRGLGSEYDPIGAAINSRPQAPSFVVSGMLLDFELRLGLLPSNTPTAFTASTASSANAPPSSPIVKNFEWSRILWSRA